MSSTRSPAQTEPPSAAAPWALCAAALLTAPLLLIPYIGFLPAIVAAAGMVTAWRAMRSTPHPPGSLVAALVVGVILCALFGGIATTWNVLVAAPAIRDYTELHEVIDYIKSLVF